MDRLGVKRVLDNALTALLPLAALVVLLLAGRGAFRSAATFPLIFSAVVILAGLLSLLVRRRRALGWHTVLVVLAMALSLGAVVAHNGHLNRARRAAEAAGMEVLATGPAPRIPYSFAVNLDPEAANPLTFGGGLTVVNFWATWCYPCREEMPALERFWQEHRSEGLEVIGVTRHWGEQDEASLRQELADVEGFLAESGITYPVVVSDKTTVKAYGVRSWPTSVLIGPRGRAMAYGVGIDGAEDLLVLAEELLREI